MMTREHKDNPDTATRFLIDHQLQVALENSVNHGATVWFASVRMIEAGCIQLTANFGAQHAAHILEEALANIKAGKLDYREGNLDYTPPPRD